MRRTRPLAAAFAALLLWVAPAAAQQEGERPAFEESTLTILTADGARHDFTIEIADTAEERGFGLMFVREMADDQGMLFDYGRDQRVSMWMENTYVPLDMLFIEADGEIESIIRRAQPHTRTPARRRAASAPSWNSRAAPPTASASRPGTGWCMGCSNRGRSKPRRDPRAKPADDDGSWVSRHRHGRARPGHLPWI